MGTQEGEAADKGAAEDAALYEWRRILTAIADGIPDLIDEYGRSVAHAEPVRTLALEPADVDDLRESLRAVALQLQVHVAALGNTLPMAEHWGSDVVVRALATELYGLTEWVQLRQLLTDHGYALAPEEPLPSILASWNGIDDSRLNAALAAAEQEADQRMAAAAKITRDAVDALWS